MTRRALAIASAVLIGIVGTLTVALYARQADNRALAGQQALQVYVVSEEIPAGTTAEEAVKRGLMRQELIARKAVPDDALTAVDPAYGQLVAAATLQPGSLVLRPSFTARAAREGALAVPPGKFAVSIALDDPSRVGSFVTVGSHVAVYDTVNVVEKVDPDKSTKEGKEAAEKEDWDATMLVLPDVEVLAVDTTTVAPSGKQDDKKNATAKANGQNDTVLFTLAVTQDEAEKLIHVARTGTPTFALLGPDTKAKLPSSVDDHNDLLPLLDSRLPGLMK